MAVRTPGEIRPAYRFQVAAYRVLAGDLVSGKAGVGTLAKTRTPKIARLYCTINEGEVKLVETAYKLAQQSIRANQLLPNRSSYLCNRKYCSAWRVCLERFGGYVE